jgi:WhiB family redox-sensing transcriptional regulator
MIDAPDDPADLEPYAEPDLRPRQAPKLTRGEILAHDAAANLRSRTRALMAPGESETPLAALLRRPAWQARAACRGTGPDAFFVDRGADTSAVAKLCARCPVAGECLAFALADPNLKGHWAGTSERERIRLRRARRAAA